MVEPVGICTTFWTINLCLNVLLIQFGDIPLKLEIKSNIQEGNFTSMSSFLTIVNNPSFSPE